MTGFIYAMQSKDAVKIGWAKNPYRRLGEVNVGSPEKLTLLGITPGSREEERELHEILSPYRIRGEWYSREAQPVAYLIGKLEPPIDGSQNRSSHRHSKLPHVVLVGAERAGGFLNLASQLGVTRNAFYSWKRVPAERVLELERITGIPRHQIREDIYPAPISKNDEEAA